MSTQLTVEKQSSQYKSSIAQQSPTPLETKTEVLNPHRWVILIAVLMGAFLELLDTTSINVALRQMAGNLGATPDEIGWVSTGYILANVVVLPLTAWLSSLFGRRLYLTGSIVVFTIASLFCGWSSTLSELVLWRIVQGAGGAALLSTAQATLREVFPSRQQGMIQALYIVVVVTGPTIGPTFGGWITDNYSWPMIFFGKAPIGFLAAAMTWRYLRDSAFSQKTSKVDFLGIGLLAIGLASLQYVLEEGERYDWLDDTNITRLIVISVITLVMFVIWELMPTNASPVVNLRVLRNPAISVGSILLFAGGAAVYGGTFILPLFVQSVLGFSPTTTGLLFLPGGVATILCTILSGQLLNGAKPLVKPPILIAIGMVGFSISQWMLGNLSVQSGQPDINAALLIRGGSLGLFFTPITVATLSSLKGSEIAQAAGITNLFRQLGGSFGIAIINTYITHQTAQHRSDLAGAGYSGNPIFMDRVASISHVLQNGSYSPITAQGASLAIVSRTVQTQASTMAYADAFMLLGTIFAVALPTLLVISRKAPTASSAPIDAGH